MFSIDLKSRTPIYEQIYSKIVELVVTGNLKENDQLPSVRTLAKDIGVNPNTVTKAYQELERGGIIYSIPGRGSFVSAQDPSFFHTAALEEFDKTAEKSLRLGVTAGTLHEHIDVISEKNQKGDTK